MTLAPDLRPGTEARYRRVVTQEDVRRFAELSGDHNPIHLDADAAARTPFKGPIAHGALSAAFLSAALARLPGLVVYLGQTLEFLKPVRPGDEVVALARVVEREGDRPRYRVALALEDAAGAVLVRGEARIMVLPPP